MNGYVYDYTYTPPLPPPPRPPVQKKMNWKRNHWSPKSSTSYCRDFSAPSPQFHYDDNRRMSEGPRYTRGGRFNHNQFRSASRQQRNHNQFGRPGPNFLFQTKPVKKKKKVLLDNMIRRQGWTREDSEKALQVERDYKSRTKNRTLIIKFPDPDLNKDVVLKFHPEIKNVHFQQPSTPRYCFVTLKETVNPDEVIQALNHKEFGSGHLAVEYKRERDDDQVVHPEEIDPFTLYVGNLSPEVTKEDMVKMYPKSRRIDLGYALKIKRTRYAFVVFRNCDDCTEAFERTHSMEVHSKSLIVRFRRLNGTVGMPGQPKQPNPSRHTGESPAQIVLDEDSERDRIDDSEGTSVIHFEEEAESDEKKDIKPIIGEDYVSPFAPGSLDEAFAQMKPKIKQEDVKVKQEDVKVKNEVGSQSEIGAISCKEEPTTWRGSEYDNLYSVKFEESVYHNEFVKDDDYVGDYMVEDDEYDTNFDNAYRSMANQMNMYSSLTEIQ